ncbi:N-succinylarginine dihydrolase, partial [Acinetobacter baumannii]
MKGYEVNFDGLVGPTHHYAGLSFGNEASTKNRNNLSNPKLAAKQGLLKMKALADMGMKQGVLAPHERPHVPMLRRLGFTGDDISVVAQAMRYSPELLSSLSSASPMWTANAATVSPSADSQDERVHFTAANLNNKFHRSIEAETTSQVLQAIFKNERPLASASIAQVHAAKLTTGEDVVIKVQKPGVETILYTDLNVVHWAAKLLERAVPKIKFAALSDIVDEIKTRMVREVDFIEEAQNLDDFVEYLNISQNQAATAPKVYHQFSTRRVLTMQRLYGVPLTDFSVVKQYAKDPSQVLITAMNTWFGSLMLCKSFHADLHAGNLMLLEDGRIGFIDFGIVGQLKPEVWTACIAFMDALQKTDYQAMAENMLKMGMTHNKIDVQVLAQDLERLFNGVLMADPQ